MAVVISDLHFEDERGDVIAAAGNPRQIDFKRNVPAVAFEDMMRDVADQVRTNGVGHIDFVLAGDIIDLYRTQDWFKDDIGLRPYIDCTKVDSAHEAKLLAIIGGIASEKEVARSLAVFRLFAEGKYLERSGDAGSAVAFGVPTSLHYLPGNHDRLANATSAIRARVRELLGVAGGDAPFPHHILYGDPPVLIRHGHEYDRYNFAASLKGGPIQTDLPAALYDAPTWGDYNTVAVAARLPFLFRRHYGDAAILDDPVLEAIYVRLLEFDDVRPQSAVIDFFLNTTVPDKFAARFAHREILQALMWKKLKPVVRELLEEVIADSYFRRWTWKFFPLVTAFMLLRPWRLPLPLRLMRVLGWFGRDAGGNPSEPYAAHEIAVHEGAACFVCAGHTHKPQVAHIFTRNDLKRFFTDTGTWRNAVLSAGDKRSYGRVNATTYVTFYGKETDPAAPYKPDHGFEFWTGYDQDWPVDNDR
ncbi:MAG TPA: hypothetical protein VGF56_02065 [Rhizomicrobium sp.]|jgi:UDP-2,3-diacylglucosamine pyrophosphatase LpxH